MGRTLVTGGGGFIGRQVVAALDARDYDIVVVGRGTRPKNIPARLTWHKLDLLEPNAITNKAIADLNADRMIHLAWETNHGGLWHNPSNFDWIGCSARLLRAFLEAGGHRVIGIGSAMEYDPPADGFCSECDSRRSNASAYAIAKDTFRRIAQHYSESFGSSFAWARVFPAYGEHEHKDRLVPSVVHALLHDEEALCSSGRQVRDFMDVRDHGEAIATLALSDVEGIVNIASGNAISIGDIVQKLAHQMDRADLVRMGALPDRADEPVNLWPEVKRLREEVNFTPARGIDEGLKDAIAWWSQRPRS
jgi:nucleoside-diphosphate-sugar epimerase